MKTFILIIYMWAPQVNAGVAMTSAEFSSWQTCEAAAIAAARKFDGFTSTSYHVCVEK